MSSGVVPRFTLWSAEIAFHYLDAASTTRPWKNFGAVDLFGILWPD